MYDHWMFFTVDLCIAAGVDAPLPALIVTAHHLNPWGDSQDLVLCPSRGAATVKVGPRDERSVLRTDLWSWISSSLRPKAVAVPSTS